MYKVLKRRHSRRTEREKEKNESMREEKANKFNDEEEKHIHRCQCVKKNSLPNKII